jgi:hypothetical protein
VPWPSSTTDAFPQGQAAQTSAKRRTGAVLRPRHASPSMAAALRTKGDVGAGIEPAASRDRSPDGRMRRPDGWIGFLESTRETKAQPQRGGKPKGEKLVEQLVWSKRHWSTALPCPLTRSRSLTCSTRSSVMCVDE